MNDIEEEEKEGCECPKDADGQCSACRNDTLAGCKAMVEVFSKFMEGAERIERELKEGTEKVRPLLDDTCSVCLDQYVDLGISKLILGFPGSEDWMPRGVLKGIKKVFADKGITAMPLTDKAWAALCASNGWTP